MTGAVVPGVVKPIEIMVRSVPRAEAGRISLSFKSLRAVWDLEHDRDPPLPAARTLQAAFELIQRNLLAARPRERARSSSPRGFTARRLLCGDLQSRNPRSQASHFCNGGNDGPAGFVMVAGRQVRWRSDSRQRKHIGEIPC
jgi:hypothetical protein